ncbi:MAG: DUF308 domain-containing protein [Rhodobacterales bacterium]
MKNNTENDSVTIGFDEAFVKRFKKTSLVIGLALVLVGIAGLAMPQITSLVSAIFFGWLLILAGVLAGYIVFLSKGQSMIAWLKPVLLAITGVLFMFNPPAGIATMALLLTFYLLLDAFSSFGLAYDYHPLQGWLWMVSNGVLSLLLAFFVLIGWPETSALWIGIFIGISLLLDGLVLIFISLAVGNTLQ